MQPIEIILHCSATKENSDFNAKDIDRWHKKRGFKKIGYHYIIKLDGTIEKGREDYEIGAHCTNHNSKSIGICYIGGLDKNNKPKDTRTISQKNSLVKLVKELMNKYGITLENIRCHYEFANKSCPCFKREDFIEEITNIS